MLKIINNFWIIKYYNKLRNNIIKNLNIQNK